MKKLLFIVSLLCLTIVQNAQYFYYTNPTGEYRVEPGEIGPSSTVYVFDRSETINLTNQADGYSNFLSYPGGFLDLYFWTSTKRYRNVSTHQAIQLTPTPDQSSTYGSYYMSHPLYNDYHNPTYTIAPFTLPEDVLSIEYNRICWNGWYYYSANQQAYGEHANSIDVVLMFNMNAGTIGPGLQVISDGRAPTALYSETAGSCVDNNPIGYGWEHSTDGVNWEVVTPIPTAFPSIENIDYTPENLKGVNYYRRATYNDTYNVPVYSNEVTVHNVYVTSPGTIRENPTSCDIRYVNFVEDSGESFSGDGSVPCEFIHGYEISYNNGATWESTGLATGQPFNVSIPFGQEFQIRRWIQDPYDQINGVRQYSNIITKGASNAGEIVNASIGLCQSNSNPIIINNVSAGSYNGQSVTYQWSVSANNSVFTDIAGATGESLNYTPSTYNENLFFQRKMYLTGCSPFYSLNSNTVEVHVARTLDGGIISSEQSTYCFEETIHDLIVNDNNGSRTPAYYWYAKPHDNSDDWQHVYLVVNNVNDRTHDLDLTSMRRRFWDWAIENQGIDLRRQVVETDNQCVSYSNVYTISTYPEINAGIIGYDETVCSSYGVSHVPDVEQVSLPSGGDGEGYSFIWEYQNEGETIWNTIQGANSARLEITELPTNTRTYRRIVHDGCLAADQYRYSNEIIHTYKTYSIEGQLPDVEACEGTTYTFNAPPTYQHYEWNLNNTVFTSGGQGFTKNLQLSDNSMALRVTDSDGCQAETESSITVNPTPTFTMPDVHICQDESIEITAPDNYASYSFDYAQPITNNSITLTYEQANQNPNRNVSVIDNNGCESSDVTYTAFAENPPAIDLPEIVEICRGETYEIFIDASPSIRNITCMLANGNIVAQGPAEFVIPVTPDVTTTYYIIVENEYCTTETNITVWVMDNPDFELRDTNACFMSNLTLTANDNYARHYWSTNNYFQGATTTIEVRNSLSVSLSVVDEYGCETTKSMQVTMNPLPSFSVNTVDGCVGDSVTLSAPTGFQSYLWENGETSREIRHIVMPFGHSNNDVEITVTDVNGCSTTNTASINTLPSPLTPGIVTQQICEGVDHIISSPRNYNSYLWSTGQTSQSITVNLFESSNMSLKVGNEYGCYDSASFDVIVNNVPEFEIKDTSICNDGSALAMQSPISGPGLSYYWSNGSIGQYALFNVNSNSQFFLDVTEGICTYRDTFNVIVHSIPQVSLPDTNICNGDSLIYAFQESYSSYLWSNGQTGSTLRTRITGNANIGLTVTDENGCVGTGNMAVTRLFPPTVYISGDDEICLGQEVELSVPSSFPDITWSTGETTPIIRHEITEETSFSVAVADVNGCMASDAISINVNPVPVGSLSDTSICNGDYVILSQPGDYSLNWSIGATGNNVLFSPSNSVRVYLTMTDNNGCVGYDSMYISVINIPSVEIPFASVCQGDSVRLESPMVFDNMIWSTGDTTFFTYVKPISSTTNVTFTYSDENGCGGIENTHVDLLTVTPFSINPQAICYGETATISAQLGFSGYLWSTGETTPTITVSPEETTVYDLVVTDKNGCRAFKETYVEVNQLPQVNIGYQSICPDLNITLSGPIGNYAYRWSNGITSRYITIPYAAAGDYNLRVTDRLTNCSTLEEFDVIAVPLPEYSFSDTTMCLGQSITYNLPEAYDFIWWDETTNNKAISPTRDTEYIVGIVDTFSCTTTSIFNVEVFNAPILAIDDIILCDKSSIRLDVPFSHGFEYYWSNNTSGNASTYHVDGYLEGWVKAENTNCEVSDTFTIVSEYMPEFNQENVIICEGDSVLVTLLDDYNYSWSTGDTTVSAYITGDKKGAIYVTATSVNGCQAYFDFMAEEEIITLHIEYDSSEIYVNTDLNIEAQAGGSTGFSYNWLIGDYSFTGKNVVFSTGTPGVYSLALDVESINACKKNYSIEDFVSVIQYDTTTADTGTTSVQDVQHLMAVSIYPNPATEFINVDTRQYNFDNQMRITIIDITGKEMLYEELNPASLNRIDIGSLKDGMYIIKLDINGFIKLSKIVKE